MGFGCTLALLAVATLFCQKGCYSFRIGLLLRDKRVATIFQKGCYSLPERVATPFEKAATRFGTVGMAKNRVDLPLSPTPTHILV